jgi:hypothetical protein
MVTGERSGGSDTMSETAEAALGEAEYRAIESTFGETTRGRLFLAEFARRSRKADITALTQAMERLKESAPSRSNGDVGRLKATLAEMASAIQDGTGALEPPGFEGLATALREAESATSDVLDAAEHIQEVAWMLRERGADRGTCDLLDGRSSEIYAACASHDAAVKRMSQALRTARLLEERVASLCDEWGVPRPAPIEPSPAPATQEPAQASSPDVAAAEPRTTEAASQREQLPSPAQAEARVEEVATATASVPAEPVDAATARRREKLAALAEIDALSIREKLKRFT